MAVGRVGIKYKHSAVYSIFPAWWSRNSFLGLDLKQGPSNYQADALPTELSRLD